ncbi:hypothetical protein O181_100802 [Austropuccinia psidii MF-1]|uniref:Uncharacterized protein n=1 Tax=Austropuccinia psidii MF-1 TaxID=1389203 RepID=A0A9Q3JES8_9BASI|nr:hypothetical protein [Austropuccinia psidii MF-1]
MDANTTNTSDMGPKKQFNSPESSDMECSSSESIIAISTSIPNPPPEFPEEIIHKSNIEAPHAHWAFSTKISTEVLLGAQIEVITKEQFLNNSSQIAPRLEGMYKDARIPQYVREKLQEARELLVADIDWALCPSANESNNGNPINTTNYHPVGIAEIGGVTNHHENIVPSPNLDIQETITVTNENIGTETQRTVAEDEIVLTQTNSDPLMDSAARSLTLTPSPSCMKIILENENKFDYIIMSYHVLKREDWIKFNSLIKMIFMKRKSLVPKDEFPTKLQCGIRYKSGRDIRMKEWLEELHAAGKQAFRNIYIGYLIFFIGLDLFSSISEEPLIYETIWNMSLFQSNMSILAGLPKRVHALYLLVHNLVQPSQHQKQRVSNILFEAIALYMDDQNPLVTFNISDSASSDSLSVEISAMRYLGSCLSVNKVQLAPQSNESQEGTSITSKGILTPTLTGLVDNILQLMIALNWVHVNTKFDSKTTQIIGKQLVKGGVDPLQAVVTIQDNMKAERPCYNLIVAFLTGCVHGLLVCSADYCISSAKGTFQLLEITSMLKRKESFSDEDIWKGTNKYICEILHETFFTNHSSFPICPSKYRLAEYLALDFSDAWGKNNLLSLI